MVTITNASFPLPIVEGADANNTLYPMKGLKGTRVIVKFDEMNQNQTVDLNWKVHEGAGHSVIGVQQGSETGSIYFDIGPETIGACIGKTVDVWYDVNQRNETVSSLRLELEVQFLEPADLPAPVVFDLSVVDGDEWLDLKQFSGDAKGQLSNWPFIAKGQKVWISCIGQRDYPAETFLPLVEAVEVNESHLLNGIYFAIPRGWLLGLDDYSALTLVPHVSFDGGYAVELAHELPRTTFKIRQSEHELFKDFTNFDGENWNGWEKTRATSDSRDLVVKTANGESFLFNWGYTSPNDGVHLRKIYPYLKSGHRYQFSLEVRMNSGAAPISRLSLEGQGVTIAGPVTLVPGGWQTLGGSFISDSEKVELRLVSHVNSVTGNDYDVTRILVEEIAEDE